MKKFFAIICAVAIAVTAIAQPQQGRPQQERPQQERQQGKPQRPQQGGDQNKPNRTVEMLKDQLKMSQAEAEKFAPIYNSMQREMRQVRKDLKMVTDHYKSKPLDIKTAVKIMNAQLNADKEIIQIKKEYIKVFKSHLTPEQLSKVFVIKPRRRPQGGKPGGQRPPQSQQGQRPQGGQRVPQGSR